MKLTNLRLSKEKQVVDYTFPDIALYDLEMCKTILALYCSRVLTYVAAVVNTGLRAGLPPGGGATLGPSTT